MVSAGLILWTQYKSWDQAFTYLDNGEQAGWVNQAVGLNPGIGGTGGGETQAVAQQLSSDSSGGRLFSNGFRYMNWSIDVPALQVQLLAVIGVAGLTFVRNAVKFTIAGLAMIYFSYAAQFFEYGFAPWAESGSVTSWFWLFYGLGWVAYIYILYAVYTSVFQQTSHMHPRAQKLMRGIWHLFLGSWTVYGIAIAMPAFAFNVHGAVWRQFLFTSVDIVSKVIYGAMLSQIALYQSAAEGYEPAIEACQWDKATAGDVPDYSAESQWQVEKETHDAVAVSHS
jgi:bacteriorhodopsin